MCFDILNIFYYQTLEINNKIIQRNSLIKKLINFMYLYIIILYNL